MLNDLGGAASVAMVRMGDALGLYKTLYDKGSMTCNELAAAASVHPRYLREWLAQQTASNYLRFRKGGGIDWGDHGPCLFCAVARFFRPGYLNNLIQNWLPALDGIEAKLRDGAKVADVGCGHGWSTVFMAQAFPQSQFIGYDFHSGSVEAARAHAREHNVSNVEFHVGTAKEYPGRDFDLLDLSADLVGIACGALVASRLHAGVRATV